MVQELKPPRKRMKKLEYNALRIKAASLHRKGANLDEIAGIIGVQKVVLTKMLRSFGIYTKNCRGY
jgi:hypothetical protein